MLQYCIQFKDGHIFKLSTKWNTSTQTPFAKMQLPVLNVRQGQANQYVRPSVGAKRKTGYFACFSVFW